MQESNSLQDKFQDEGLHLKEQFDNYLKYWGWFVFSIAICLFLSFLYLRYTQPQYKASATIVVKDERKGNMQSELSAFSDLGLMTGVKNNVDNEIEIIKSRNIIQTAVKKLNFNISYFTEGRVKTIEVYKDNPIDVSFFDTDDSFYEKYQSYIVNSKSSNTYELAKLDGKTIGVFKYGTIIRLSNCKMVVTKKPLPASLSEKEFSITLNINNLENTVQNYKNRIN